MSIERQIEDLEKLNDFLKNQLPVFSQQVLASDLIALVANRVVQKGQNFKGGSFSPYSSKTVAAWRFWGKSRTQAAEEKVRKRSRARLSLSYKEFRELNNLNTGKKNFEFTGQMWREFGIVRVKKAPLSFSITIAGTTTNAQTKIDDNSQREGVSIIEASEAEKSLVERTAQDWIDDQAKRILE